MAKKLSKTGIVTNQLVLPHQVTQSIDALTGEQDYDINLSGSLAITGSTTMKLGGLTISDSILGPGSLYVTNITASNLQVVNISSSFVTSSTIYTSGSNIFGDEPSDTHTFIGGITASGVMSASGVVFGSQVKTPSILTDTINEKGTEGVIIEGTLLKDNDITVVGRITASSTISASGDIYAPNIEFKGNSSINSFPNSTLTISHNNSQRVSYSSNDTTFTNREVIINSSAGKLTVDGTITSSGNIETDGYFSGSGAGLNNIPASGITGLNLSEIKGGTAKTASIDNSGFRVNTDTIITGSLLATTDITASGIISASDKVFGDRMIASAYVQTPSLESPNTLIEVAANLNVSGEITSSGNIKGKNLILSNGGSSAAPAIRLSNDTNNGIYFPAPDNIIFVNAGASTLATNTSAINLYKPAIFSDTLTVGTSGTGHDVTFYGDTNGKFVQWDQSEDKLTIAGDTTVTGDSIFSGKFAITSSAGEVFEVMTTNAAASSAGIEIHSAATQTNRKVGLTFTASNDGGTTNEYTMGLARDVGSFIIVQNDLPNLSTSNAIFEMGATGAITASGDISCSFQESIITATTGSFNHIITDGETLEFRNAATRAKVGSLKFDPTNGLEVKDSTGAEGKMKTRELFVGGPINAFSITASAGISASGDIYAPNIEFKGNSSIESYDVGTLNILQNNSQRVSFSSTATTFGNREVVVGSSCTTFKVDVGRIDFTNLPTSDPNIAGRLWNRLGTLQISDGE